MNISDDFEYGFECLYFLKVFSANRKTINNYKEKY